MTQTAVMIALTLLGTVGVFIAPIFGVCVYYLFAVLRPQALWVWALPAETPWSLFVALGAMLGLLIHAIGLKKPPERVHPEHRTLGAAHVTLLLFAIWLTLSYWRARDQAVAWPWYLEYLKMFLMFFVSAVLIQTLRHIWALMLLTAGALGYIAYEVNFEYFTTGNVGIFARGFGGLDNNGAGLMMAMALPLCVFIYLGATSWWRWIYAALIPIILHAVLLTYSRGAMVALIVAAPAIFVRKRHRVQLTLAAIAVVAILPFLAGKEIREEFFSVDSYEDDYSAQSRFASWSAAYKIALDYPIFGVGIRNSNLMSYEYGADQPGRTVHNQYLQTLADSGFPALVLYLALILCVAVSLRRVRRWAVGQQNDDGRIAYATACGLEGALLVYYVGIVFLSLDGFEVPVLLWLMGAQLPLVLGLGIRRSSTPVPAALSGHPGGVISPVVLAGPRSGLGPVRRPLATSRRPPVITDPRRRL